MLNGCACLVPVRKLISSPAPTMAFLTGDAPIWAEVVMPLASVLIFSSYYSVQRCCERQSLAQQEFPARLSMSRVMRHARRAWVHVHHARGGGAGVNTMRDYIRSSSFFASSNVVVAFGLVGLIITAYPNCLPGATADNASADCASSTALLMGKIALVSGAFLISAFLFSQAVRLATHAEFLITVPASHGEHSTLRRRHDAAAASPASNRHLPLHITPAFVATVLDRATENWTWGLRTLYFVPSLAMNIVSPYLTLAVALASLAALHRLDHLGLPHVHILDPEGAGSEEEEGSSQGHQGAAASSATGAKPAPNAAEGAGGEDSAAPAPATV